MVIVVWLLCTLDQKEPSFQHKGGLLKAGSEMFVACPGCVVPELLSSTGNVPWFEAGATIFSAKGIQYLGIPGLINAKNIVATLIVQVRFSFTP
jgi:hypothetical protein